MVTNTSQATSSPSTGTPARKKRRIATAELEGSSRSRSRSQTLRADDAYKKDMYLLFVRNALKEKTKGNASDFNELVTRFSPSTAKDKLNASSSEMKLWLAALTHVVSGLEKTHAALIDALVGLPWTTMDESFVKSYMGFIGMLVSARPEYLGGVLAKIVRGFTFQSGIRAVNNGAEPKNGESSKGPDPVTRRLVYSRLHALLQRLISLIPTLSTTLEPYLTRNFPHKRQDKNAQITYIRNMLQVSSYCPELNDRILSTVVDRAIQIDVEIQVELEDLDEAMLGDEVMLHKDPFDTLIGESDAEDDDDEDSGGDALSDISSDAGSVASGEKHDQPADITHVTEMISKLDAILKLLFDHLNSIGASSPTSSSSDVGSIPSTPLGDFRIRNQPSFEDIHALRRQQFYALLTIFDRTIIRTFKSRYTQFLLFWYSSLDAEFSDLFQGVLVSKALIEVDHPVVTRCAAASYVASFISRARFIDPESTIRVVGLLCRYLEGQLDQVDALITESHGSPVNAAGGQFAVFYAVAQAVFLIFCFRWRDLLNDQAVDEDEDYFAQRKTGGVGKKWIHELDVFHRLIASPLNPLKICSSNVVKQFAHIAQATGFVYCYGIIESNRRAEWSTSFSSPVATPITISKRPSSYLSPAKAPTMPVVILPESSDDATDLNSFFPFDPYKLPLSNSYIAGVYREWGEVALDEEEEEDSDEEGDAARVDDGDDGIIDQERGLRVPLVDDEIARSFEGMSISPVRQMAMAMAK